MLLPSTYPCWRGLRGIRRETARARDWWTSSRCAAALSPADPPRPWTSGPRPGRRRGIAVAPLLQAQRRWVVLQDLPHLRLLDLEGQTRPLEFQQHRHARVALAPAAVERLGHLHERQLAEPHGHAELTDDGGGQAHVLVGQAQRHGRRVVAVLQKVVAEAVVQALAAVGALAHGLPERGWLEPGLGAHREDLRERRLHGVARAVVDQLGDGARADGADVDRVVAHGVEHGLVAGVELFLASAPPGQAARPRP